MRINSLVLTAAILCLIGSNSVSAQEPASSSQQKTLVFNFEVLEFSKDLAREIDRLAQDRGRIDKLTAEGKIRPISSVQLRTRPGESASARVGQRVPLQVSSQPQSQVQYENTGLNIDITPNLMADSAITAALKIELTAVARGGSTTTPAFLQRSLTDRVRMKPGESTVLLSVVQHGSLWPGLSEPQSSEAESSNFVVLLTARILD
jgi:type II secretory pathway component GspD/PulD (secretin)